MDKEQAFQETVTTFQKPEHFFALIVNQAGFYLGVDNIGGELRFFASTDDQVIWETKDDGLRHVLTGTEVVLDRTGIHSVGNSNKYSEIKEGGPFHIARGPEYLPSTYLQFFKEHGWVCLNSILAPEIVLGLEKITCTDRFEHLEFNTSTPPLNQSPFIAKAAAEPLSLWLMRQYMQTDDIRLAHTPGLAILDPDDSKRNTQGWHSDYPYLWGITGHQQDSRVPTASGSTVLGVQRNVCISDFTKLGGATAFKLGSHILETPPPESWGRGSKYFQSNAREQYGLPYSGPEADIIETPGGSIILYDARTWHRAGINRKDKKRAAMLQAVTPMYIMPFSDTSESYKKFAASDAHEGLTELEQSEFRRLMIHTISGPSGTLAITVDPELTEVIKKNI